MVSSHHLTNVRDVPVAIHRSDARVPGYQSRFETRLGFLAHFARLGDDKSGPAGTQPVQKTKPPVKNPCNVPNPPHDCKRPKPPEPH